ncbi:hypothetical protein [Sphingomonas sp.]|uniref:hypothetical protein n=1 Tax=Sphingomonas sp. TaxID=28214 RepID=UPI002DB79EEB|nr:hypothetical protein [Sphingomonas sp.]HEU4970062.1 hypothetical protein [Sphingomonas sp.]
MRALPLLALAFTLPALAACSGGNSTAAPRPGPIEATPTPTPSPTATGTSFDVTRCLNQQPAPGVSVANLVIPDTLKLDVTKANGFPNGRGLADPVIDITLAMAFLDLTKHPLNLLASLPLDPPGNKVTLPADFPYLAPANGTPPMPSGGGTNFNFRSDPPSAYVRVDRMGMPAIATALVSSSMKNAYNDANPSDDASGKFVVELGTTLTKLTDMLADDFQRLSLNMCATPKTT